MEVGYCDLCVPIQCIILIVHACLLLSIRSCVHGRIFPLCGVTDNYSHNHVNCVFKTYRISLFTFIIEENQEEPTVKFTGESPGLQYVCFDVLCCTDGITENPLYNSIAEL